MFVYIHLHMCSQREIQQIKAAHEHTNDALRACNSWWPSLSSHGHVVSVQSHQTKGDLGNQQI